MTEEERWGRVEEIVRRVVREELAAAGLKQKQVRIGFSMGKWTGVTEEHLTAWKEAYPAVAVEEELKKAAAWIVSNPNDAPRSNFARFLNTWMERNQNRASLRAIPTQAMAVAQKKSTCKYCMRPASGVVNGIAHCPLHMEDAMDSKQAVA